MPNIEINAPKIEGKISTEDINIKKIEGDIKVPDISIKAQEIKGNVEGEIKITKTVVQTVEIETQKLKSIKKEAPKTEEKITISSDIPLNLNSLLKGNIDDPIALNKRTLHFPGLSYKTPEISIKKEIKTELNISSFKSQKVVPKTDLRGSLQFSRKNVKLPTLNDVIDSTKDEIDNNLDISKTKESISSSSAHKRIRSSKVNVNIDPKRLSKSTIMPKVEEKKLPSEKGVRTSRVARKSSKGENLLNISANLAKTKIKNRPSLTNVKPKEVKLPAKLIKMKDMISLKYSEPIHDVKEIPKFDIYYPKK